MSEKKNLDGLYCSDNVLTDLNISGDSNLYVIYCYNNQLVDLDVTDCDNLIELRCYNNYLNNLDVSNNNNLQSLWCFNNNILSLDISKNDRLHNCCCWDNYFTSVDVSNHVSKLQTDFSFRNFYKDYNGNFELWPGNITYDSENKTMVFSRCKASDDPDVIAIDNVYFKDNSFREYVLNNIDKNKNKYLSETEIYSVFSIDCSDMGINSLVH